MRKLFVLALAAVFCASAFAGCATTPKKDLEEKDAVIRDLNSRMAVLAQEVENLKSINRQLESEKVALARKIADLEQAAQQKTAAAETNVEPNLK
jgi:outer membrane murein-binding lipoprotein Lpp